MKRAGFISVAIAAVALAALVTLAAPAQAATFTVTNTNDSGAGSLRQAITDANDETTNPGNDVIEFAPGVEGTIELTSQLPSLFSDMEITGPGADKLTVRRSTASGTPDFAIFIGGSGLNISISGLTISNGKTSFGGGGINTAANLNITNSAISGNNASSEGGGISNGGTLNVTNSTISGNSVSGSQGRGGGGISSGGGTVSVTNSTISGNSATKGGGITLAPFNAASTSNVANSTISGNSASSGQGGGIFMGGGSVDVRSSIVAGNTGGEFVGVGLINGGFNLIGGDPKLGPLQNNGGPTRTHAPLEGSPALDKGNSFGLTSDQRGDPRPQDIPSIGSATGGDGSDIGAVEMLGVSIGNARVTEGNSGSASVVFTVQLSGASSVPVTVGYATEDDTASSPADYQAASGSVSFLPGETSKTITVMVAGDTLDEFTENFLVNLSNVPNPQGVVYVRDGPGIGTIFDNDPAPSLSVMNNPTVFEGSSATTSARFTVRLSATSGKAVTVDYSTQDGTAHSPGDYSETFDTLYFSPGTMTKAVTVPINGDTLDEPNEQFTLNLSNASNAAIFDSLGIATITDDDATPTLSVGDATVTEGDSGATNMVFEVSLSAASGQAVNVNYSTLDGTATIGSDYMFASGTLAFAPGQTKKTVSVPVLGDTSDEPDETFSVVLDDTSVSNATISDGTGTGTIDEDDDKGPAVTVTTSTLRSANITVQFSEPMKPSTLMQNSTDPTQPSTSETIKLFQGGTEVLAKVSCTDASCQTVTLNPDVRLGKRKTYTVRIEGAGDGDDLAVADSGGNELAQDFSKIFKTGLR